MGMCKSRQGRERRAPSWQEPCEPPGARPCHGELPCVPLSRCVPSTRLLRRSVEQLFPLRRGDRQTDGWTGLSRVGVMIRQLLPFALSCLSLAAAGIPALRYPSGCH